ncbi:MAG: LysR family transcriptional regulator [Pseudomonadota bacterium]|nr:LysR family transcriptional regulator [Pseudomonadota bacterium]
MLTDLDDLALFVAVADQGGFSAAARSLGIPKSRVSRRLAGLESRLDLRLVERSTRRVSVTPAGEEVLAHARAALGEAEAIAALAARRHAEPQGLIRASCPVGADRPLVAALPGFLAAHPRIRVHLLLTNRRVDLIEEGVDVAIRVRERLEGEADFQARIVGPSRAVLVAAPSLLDALGRPARPEDLARFPLLDRAEQPRAVTWGLTGPGGERFRLTGEARFATGDFAALRRAAEAGLGLCLVPVSECVEALESGRLEHVCRDWLSDAGIMHLVYPSRRGLLPGMRAFLDFAADTLGAALAASERTCRARREAEG